MGETAKNQTVCQQEFTSVDVCTQWPAASGVCNNNSVNGIWVEFGNVQGDETTQRPAQDVRLLQAQGVDQVYR